MLKKRLIGVITVLNGSAVQSFGYRRYLPLGRPAIVAENLDRWGADEILVLCIDRSARGLGPDLEVLSEICALGLSTPVMYGGGVRTPQDAVTVIETGAERICIDTLVYEDPDGVSKVAARVGAQAVVVGMPLSIVSGQLEWLNYRTRQPVGSWNSLSIHVEENTVSEILVIDWRNEGRPNGFDMALINLLPFPSAPIIVFGGISESRQVQDLLAVPRVAGVAIGNCLSYSEHAIQHLKARLVGSPIRPSVFARNEVRATR